ncbi:MAG: hypothetical protein Q9170_002187 [Blastenia crenularia]
MPPPIHLLLDWDSTLTTTSTLPLIAQTGYSLNDSSSQHNPLLSWNSISSAYLSDYRAHSSAYTPRSSDRKTIQEEFAWLESLRDVERKSIERVEKAGIFRNVERKHVHQAAEAAIKGRKVVLRKGWGELMKIVLQGGGKLGIVSVGWSGEFIRGCLRTATAIEETNVQGEEGVGQAVDVAGINIRANEILCGAEGKMSRYFEEEGKEGDGGIWTARDKRRVMEDVVRDESRGRETVVVYLGDSVTDLECLLSADVGICVRNAGEMSSEQNELEQTLMRLGISCRWIGEARSDNIERKSHMGRRSSLWWARGLDEACNYAFSCTSYVTQPNKTYYWNKDVAMMSNSEIFEI